MKYFSVILPFLYHFLILTKESPSSTHCAQSGNSFPWLANLVNCAYEEPRFPSQDELEPANWNINKTQADEIKKFLERDFNEIPKYKTVADKIESAGYKSEIHKVTTADGYVLTYNRIPHGKEERSSNSKSRPPVLIQHGLFGHSGYWLTQKESNNLPYILADEGYDVWLGNARGTVVSQSHLNLTTNDPDFWDFSYKEMGYYDITAGIDYILAQNGHQKLFYIGHSMGTTMFFVGMSTRPEYNAKIRLMMAYAPVGFVFHMTSAARIFSPLGFAPQRKRQVLASQAVKAISPMLDRFCDPMLMTSTICSNILFLLAGFDYQQTNMSNLGHFLSEAANPTSLKTIEHYTQGLVWDHFRNFNRGRITNCEVYGTCTPPEFDLSAVTSPVALFYGLNDNLANIKDVQRLVEQLPNLVLNYSVPFEEWNHVDFLTAIQVRELLYEPTLKLMKQF